MQEPRAVNRGHGVVNGQLGTETKRKCSVGASLVHKSISFRYVRKEARSDYLEAFEGAMRSQGLALVHREEKVSSLFTSEDLREAESVLFTPREVEQLRQAGKIPLSSQRTRIVTRPVAFTRYEYANESQELNAVVICTADNNFPVLGQDLWLSQPLRLPAGLIRIAGEQTKVNAIVNQIKHFLNESEDSGIE